MSEETSKKNEESEKSIESSSSESKDSITNSLPKRVDRSKIRTNISKKISNEPKIELLDNSNDEIEESDQEHSEESK